MLKEKEKLKTAIQKLERIVEELSKKDIDIEEGLEKFKEGVDLIKFCRGQLQKAENANGEITNYANAQEKN